MIRAPVRHPRCCCRHSRVRAGRMWGWRSLRGRPVRFRGRGLQFFLRHRHARPFSRARASRKGGYVNGSTAALLGGVQNLRNAQYESPTRRGLIEDSLPAQRAPGCDYASIALSNEKHRRLSNWTPALVAASSLLGSSTARFCRQDEAISNARNRRRRMAVHSEEKRSEERSILAMPGVPRPTGLARRRDG